jgi:hypothetical protein
MLTDQQLLDLLDSGTRALESVDVAKVKPGDIVLFPDEDDPCGRYFRRVRLTFASRFRVGSSKRLRKGLRIAFYDGWDRTSERLVPGNTIARVIDAKANS